MNASKLLLPVYLLLLGCQHSTLQSPLLQPQPVPAPAALQIGNGKWEVGSLTLSRDGQIGFFDWNISGERQIWRLVRPRGIPQQVTQGPDEFEVLKATPDGSGILALRHLKDSLDSQFVVITSGTIDPIIRPLEEPNGWSKKIVAVSADALTYYLETIDSRRHEMRLAMVTIGEIRSSRNLLRLRGDWRVEDCLFENRFLLSHRLRKRTQYYFWHESQATPTLINLPLSIQVNAIRFAQTPNSFYLLANSSVQQPRPESSEDLRLDSRQSAGLYEFNQGKLRLITDAGAGSLNSFDVDQRRFHIYLERKLGNSFFVETWDIASGQKLGDAICPECENFHVVATSRFGRFVVLKALPSTGAATERPEFWPKQISYDWRDLRSTTWISGSPVGQVPRALRPMRSF